MSKGYAIAPGNALGIVVNPVSGNDVRRVTGRAGRATQEGKVEQVARCALGAVAAGVERLLVLRDPFRIAEGALEHLPLRCEVEWLDVPCRVHPSDTRNAALAMRAAGAGALAVLGGDGTARQVAMVWPDVVLVAMAQGTNNAFPELCEPTAAGVALGLLLNGRVSVDSCAPRAKVALVRPCSASRPSTSVASEGEIALIDAVLLAEQRLGSSLPFAPEDLRSILLTRAEPSAMGISALGGALRAVPASSEFGLLVETRDPDDRSTSICRHQVVPVAPGAFETFHVSAHRTVSLGERTTWCGPGVIACDGDRLIALAENEAVEVWVDRVGPRQLDVSTTLAEAAASGALQTLRMPRLGEAASIGCC